MGREKERMTRSCLSYRRTLLPQIRRREGMVRMPGTPTITVIPTTVAAAATALIFSPAPTLPKKKVRVSVGHT